MTSWGLDHLWQTTLVVIFIALFVKVIGLADARIRYAVWLTASIKFLVPFSLLVSAGQAVGTLIHPVTVAPRIPASFEILGQPFSARAVVDAATAPASGAFDAYLVPAAIGLWLMGCVVTLVVRARRWRHAALRAARAPVLETGREVDALRRVLARSPRTHQVTIRLAAPGHGPGLFGVVRPVLLWPAGLSTGLTDDAIDAIVTHELSHLRRADNLASLVHTLVEALFWFHPMVWWLGRRLVEDRERACDETVLSLGTPPQAYAESLLDVCRFSLGARVPFVAGAASSPLAQRVEAIMTYRTRRMLGRGRRLLLIGAGLAAVLGPIAVGVGNAQSPAVARVAVPVGVPHEMSVPVLVETPQPVDVQPAPTSESSVPATSTAWPQDAAPGDAGRGISGEFIVSGLKAVRMVRPTYSSEALRAGSEGTVELEVLIRSDGTVEAARISKGIEPDFGLNAQALAAARQWLFEPPTSNGQPVQAIATLVLDFRLPKTEPPPTGAAPATVQPPQVVQPAAPAPPRDPKPATEREEIAAFRRGAFPSNTPGLEKAVPTRQSQPQYTSDAMRAKIQGTVELEVVVTSDGRVDRVRVVRSLDQALDAQAISAARQWIFEPAKLNGQAVPVLVTLVLDFRLY